MILSVPPISICFSRIIYQSEAFWKLKDGIKIIANGWILVVSKYFNSILRPIIQMLAWEVSVVIRRPASLFVNSHNRFYFQFILCLLFWLPLLIFRRFIEFDCTPSASSICIGFSNTIVKWYQGRCILIMQKGFNLNYRPSAPLSFDA
jgi:hypothetical protein